MRPLAQLIAAAFIIRWLLAALSGRIHPIGALGISMATIVVFSPFAQAWYLLWAVIPLAAWASDRWFRLGAIISSALIATVVMPTSSNTTGIVLAQGLLAAMVASLKPAEILPLVSASFSLAGTYVLQLAVSDTALVGSDTVSIQVDPVAPTNVAPVVNAVPGWRVTHMDVAASARAHSQPSSWKGKM